MEPPPLFWISDVSSCRLAAGAGSDRMVTASATVSKATSFCMRSRRSLRLARQTSMKPPRAITRCPSPPGSGSSASRRADACRHDWSFTQ